MNQPAPMGVYFFISLMEEGIFGILVLNMQRSVKGQHTRPAKPILHNNTLQLKSEGQMQKGYQSFMRWIISATFFFTAVVITIPVVIYSQTLAVQGVVTSSTVPVRYASITFMNSADTNNKIILQTDTLGKYSVSLPTSVQPSEDQPTDFELGQNYPNPFASSTAISYKLKTQSNVHVTVYDILGREIKKFAVGMQQAGLHGVLWDGKDNFGVKAATGVYFYRLQVGAKTLVKKMLFGTGESNVFVLPPTMFSSKGLEIKKEMYTSLQVGTYIVRVENTDSTSPTIYTQKKTVVLQGDTTLNFITGLNAAVVYFDDPQQIIRGFGASNILLWRPDMTLSEIETAFGTGEGQLGFSILRIMLEKDSTRWGLNLQTVKKAQEMGATIIASPWHAPDRMSEDVGGINRVRHDMYAEYAAHINSFISFMTNNGVILHGVSIQNEPDIEDQWTSWTSAEIFTFMKDYAHVIEGTLVMAPESFHFDRTYSDPILNDSIACANTDIVCGHIYGSGLTAYPLAKNKGKEVWMTEYLINSNGNGSNMDTSLAAAVLTAKTISDCMKAGMNAYVWWYIVRYYGPISDGEMGSPKGTVTKKGYMMSQFSRFVRPGYSMVNVIDNNSSTQVDVTAYRFGSSKIIVAVNRKTTAKIHTFDLQKETAGILTPYVTTGTKNCEQQSDVSFKNGSFTHTLEPQSVTTFVVN